MFVSGMETSVTQGDTVMLKSNNIAYLHDGIWTEFQDVVILSENGTRFGFNRCLLASLSSICKKLFLHLYDCPVANLDEVIYISSDFTDHELNQLRDLFVSGVLRSGIHPAFTSIGLDFNDIHSSFKDSLSVRPEDLRLNGGGRYEDQPADKVEVKLEVEDLNGAGDYIDNLYDECFPKPELYEESSEEAPLKKAH